MKERKYILQREYIELIKLLKLLNLAESGAHAKLMVEEGEIQLNGENEYRKRAKLRSGDIIQCNDVRVLIETESKKSG